MNKCIGCGIELQNKNKETQGYTTNIENNLCERCFRIKNYGEYKKIKKDNKDYINILKKINKTNDLVVLVIDIFNLTENLNIIKENIKNKILLVVTKKDILPKTTTDEKIKNYIKNYKINTIDIVIISSYKNYNFDELYKKINQNKTTKNVYIVGFTNAGKSTMINKIIKNYSENTRELTTSIMPSTTLDEIEIKINDELTLIDTPGILPKTSFYDILEGKELNKIIPKKEIKPITFQIKQKQYIEIDKYALIETENMDLTLFVSNNLNIKRLYKKPETKLTPTELELNKQDIVINGLGFIKCTKQGKIKIYTYDNIALETRKHLI